MTIFWFRRDLRLLDNTGLNLALLKSKDVQPIFIFDKDIINELPNDDPQMSTSSDCTVCQGSLCPGSGNVIVNLFVFALGSGVALFVAFRARMGVRCISGLFVLQMCLF